MSDLFNYFVKAASAPKPDAAMRRGSYAQASASGQYRSSTIGHQGLSKRTAAQLRQTHNLPNPGQQPTGPDAGLRRGGMAQGGQRRPTASVDPSPAPRTSAQPARPATIEGAPPDKPAPAAAVDPNSNLGWFRNKMLGDVREKAKGPGDPLAQAYGALRQYKTDADLQKGLQQGYRAQLDGILDARKTGKPEYLSNPQYQLFKYFQDATALDNAGWDKSQWGHRLQQDALPYAQYDDETLRNLGLQ